MSKSKHALGWRVDLPDQRDLAFEPSVVKLPSVVDLRPEDTAIYDQGQLGSCTANAIAAHLDFNRKKQGEAAIKPSRLFIYYNERKDQGTIASDSGASIRESAKAVKNYGACPEPMWAYHINQFKVVPTDAAYTTAVGYEALSYLSIARELSHLKSRLAEGFPFVIGISVYDSFESDEVAKTGIVPMPKPDESLLGGHAVMVVGYDDTKEHFIVRNSWGASWGDKGYFYLPYSYLTNSHLSSSFWTLKTVK